MRLVIRASPAVSEAISACSTPHFTCVMVTGLEAAFKAFADGARALIVEAGAPDVATFVADCRARCTGLVVIAATAQPVNDALADLVDEVISVPVHPAELKLRLRTLARLTGLGGGGGPTGSHSASLAQITDARALWAALKLIADRCQGLSPTGVQRVGHVPLILKGIERWVDLIVWCDAAVEKVVPLVSLVTQLRDALMAQLIAAHETVLCPIEPSVIELPAIAPEASWALHFEFEHLRFSLTEEHLEVESRVYEDLRVGDVLLEPLVLPGSALRHVLEANVLVTSTYLRHLKPLIGEVRDDAALVARPSSVYLHLREGAPS